MYMETMKYLNAMLLSLHRKYLTQYKHCRNVSLYTSVVRKGYIKEDFKWHYVPTKKENTDEVLGFWHNGDLIWVHWALSEVSNNHIHSPWDYKYKIVIVSYVPKSLYLLSSL